jgi:hypothetical protein
MHDRQGVSALDRRAFIRNGAGAVAAAAVLSSQGIAAGAPPPRRRASLLPVPKPIPGGMDLSGFGLPPPYDFIHTFVPGPAGQVLPFTGGTLQGLDVERGTVTNFRGSTANAYHVGTAEGSDGRSYNLETDMRVMKGTYRKGGTEHRGTFAFI